MVIKVCNSVVNEQLSIFRDKDSSLGKTNKAVEIMSVYLAGEVSNLLSVTEIDIQTPLGMAKGIKISDDIVLVPIARAGVAMLSSFLKLLPCSHIGMIAASRNKDLSINIMYDKLNGNLSGKTVIILDTMLATGSTINEVISLIRTRGCNSIIIATILATPIGIKNIQEKLDIPIFSIDVNESLDDKNYVYPGVGDSGDRLFGVV